MPDTAFGVKGSNKRAPNKKKPWYLVPSHWVEKRFSRALSKLARLCAKRPWIMLLTPLAVLSLSAIGFSKIAIELKFINFMIPQESRPIIEFKGYEELWGRSAMSAAIVFEDDEDGGNLLTSERLLETHAAFLAASRAVAEVGDDTGRSITVDDICEKIDGRCSTASVLLYFECVSDPCVPMLSDALADNIRATPDIAARISDPSAVDSWGRPLAMLRRTFLGGVSPPEALEDPTVPVTAATHAINVIFNHYFDDDDDDNDDDNDGSSSSSINGDNGAATKDSVMNWESEFIDTWDSLAPERSYALASRSEQDGIEETSTGNIDLIAISMLVMVIIVVFALSRGWPFRRSRASLALLGVSLVTYSVIVAYGITVGAGWKITPAAQLTFFILLSTGANGYFALVAEFDRRKAEFVRKHPLGDRLPARDICAALPCLIACTVHSVGASIAYTSGTSVIAFFTSGLTEFPVLKYFAITTGIAVIVNFILTSTCFIAGMALDERRKLRSRLDCFCCIVSARGGAPHLCEKSGAEVRWGEVQRRKDRGLPGWGEDDEYSEYGDESHYSISDDYESGSDYFSSYNDSVHGSEEGEEEDDDDYGARSGGTGGMDRASDSSSGTNSYYADDGAGERLPAGIVPIGAALADGDTTYSMTAGNSRADRAPGECSKRGTIHMEEVCSIASGASEPALERVFKKYGTLFGSRKFSGAIVALGIMSTALAAWGTADTQVSFDPGDFLPNSSSAKKFLEERKAGFADEVGDAVLFSIESDDFSSLATQREVESIYRGIVASDAFRADQTFSAFQITLEGAREAGTATAEGAYIEPAQFDSFLAQTLSAPGIGPILSGDVDRDETTGRVVKARIRAELVPIKTLGPDSVDAMDAAFEICDNVFDSDTYEAGGEGDGVKRCSAFADTAFPYAQMVRQVKKELFPQVALAWGLVTVFLFIVNPPAAAAIMSVLLAMTVVNIIGFVRLVGLTVDPTNLIALAIASGLAVDFQIHIAHIFVMTPGTRAERVAVAMGKMGASVLQAGLSTAVGTAVLLFARSLGFVFFALIFIITDIMGLITGIVFLPAVLFFIGPSSDADYPQPDKVPPPPTRRESRAAMKV